MFYIRDIETNEIVAKWSNLEKAIGSMRYLSETHRKEYEVLSVAYTTENAKDKDYGDYLQEQMDKYGCD
jgi:hypothetical protein